MPLPKPLNNNVLIEVLRNDSDVSVADDSTSLQFGKIINGSISRYHLTASSFGELDASFMQTIRDCLKVGSIVRWEEFAEGGQTFKQDKKTYALIPWWRLISIEEETN